MNTNAPPGPGAVAPAGRPGLITVVRPAEDHVAALFRAEYPRLVGLARILVDDESADVVQEAFARLLASWHRLRKPERAAPYLRVTVLNVARGTLRRRRRQRGLVPERAATVELTVSDPAVLHAVRRLPARQRDCVLLRFYLDLSARDIADTTGLSAGTVKNHLHRAMRTLATALEEDR